MIKIGDRVIVGSFKNMPATVSRIYYLNNKEEETKWQFERSRVMFELTWPHGYGKSKISLYDENKYWYKYSESN